MVLEIIEYKNERRKVLRFNVFLLLFGRKSRNRIGEIKTCKQNIEYGNKHLTNVGCLL